MEAKGEPLELKRIFSMLNKAAESVSINEKNECIAEIEGVFLPFCDTVDSVNSLNQLKRMELNRLEQQAVETRKTIDSLISNTAFNSYPAVRKETDLISSIATYQKELQRSGVPIEHPDELTTIKALPRANNCRYYSLYNMLLKTIERLAYALKKRELIVEGSQESTDIVLEEFGSVTGLIDELHRLESENCLLKDAERRYYNDAFTRRYNFTTMPVYSTRSLALVFQEEIDMSVKLAALYKKNGFKTLDSEAGATDFNTLIRDSLFTTNPLAYEPAEFGNALDVELSEAIAAAKDPASLIRLMTTAAEFMASTSIKLQQEIDLCRGRSSRRADSNPTRIEKLMDTNLDLLDKVSETSHSLGKVFEEIHAVHEKLMRAQYERRTVALHFAACLGVYNRLRQSHAHNLKLQARNVHVSNTLAAVADYFGTSVMNQAWCSSLNERLRGMFIKPSMSRASSKHGFATHRRSGRTTLKKQNEERAPLQFARPGLIELVEGFSLIADIQRKTGYQRVLQKLMHYSTELSRSNKEALADFYSHVNENFRAIHLHGNRILVKEKRTVAMQTGAAPRDSQLIQTNESAMQRTKHK